MGMVMAIGMGTAMECINNRNPVLMARDECILSNNYRIASVRGSKEAMN